MPCFIGSTRSARKSYSTDVDDDGRWRMVICRSLLTLMVEDAPQRKYDLRELFNALRWILRSGSPWRLMPHDFPRWKTVYQQTKRWIKSGCFEAMVHDLRALLRNAEGRCQRPAAAIFDFCSAKDRDSRILQATSVEVGYMDQGCTGEDAEGQALA